MAICHAGDQKSLITGDETVEISSRSDMKIEPKWTGMNGNGCSRQDLFGRAEAQVVGVLAGAAYASLRRDGSRAGGGCGIDVALAALIKAVADRQAEAGSAARTSRVAGAVRSGDPLGAPLHSRPTRAGDGTGEIIAGHVVVEAAAKLDFKFVPVVEITQLSEGDVCRLPADDDALTTPLDTVVSEVGDIWQLGDR